MQTDVEQKADAAADFLEDFAGNRGLHAVEPALKRPGLVTGAFAIGYGVARIVCEFFREPDAQLGFLWGGLTMGMLLCIPLILAGIGVLVFALTRQPIAKNG